jgi:outer membrane biosynthesis protein TonB
MGEHEKHLGKMLDGHKCMLGEMRKTFEEHHPDLEPLEAPEGEEAPEKKPEDKKPEEKPKEKPEEKTLPIVETKTAPEGELDEADALLVLRMLERIDKKSVDIDTKSLEQQKRLSRALGQAS